MALKNKFSAYKLQMKQFDANITPSMNIMEKIAEREHPPGVRKPGCPCCDPDGISIAIDKMFF